MAIIHIDVGQDGVVDNIKVVLIRVVVVEVFLIVIAVNPEIIQTSFTSTSVVVLVTSTLVNSFSPPVVAA